MSLEELGMQFCRMEGETEGEEWEERKERMREDLRRQRKAAVRQRGRGRQAF